MISYEVYKMTHVLMVVLMFSTMSLVLLGNAEKKYKILQGISGLLILVSGMGLIARIGIGHGEPWPLWIKLKIAIWFFISIGGAIVGKRMRNHGGKFVLISFILLFAVTYLVNYKIG